MPVGATASTTDEKRKEIKDSCDQYKQLFINADIRVRLDNRDNYSPGWKFNHWELKVYLYSFTYLTRLFPPTTCSELNVDIFLSMIVRTTLKILILLHVIVEILVSVSNEAKRFTIGNVSCL